MSSSQTQARDDDGSRGYNSWNPSETLTLLTLLYEGVNLGWRNSNGSIGKTTIDTKILPELKRLTGRDLNYNQYMSIWKWLKRQYAKFSILRKFSSGFGWDKHTKTFVANDEVWQDFFKSHPRCGNLKTDTVEGWDMLEVVVGKVVSTGGNMAGISAEETDYVRPQMSDTQPPDETQSGDEDHQFEEIEDIEGNIGSEATTGSKRKRPREDGFTSREVPYVNEFTGIVNNVGDLLGTFRSIRGIMDEVKVAKAKEQEDKAKEQEDKAKEREEKANEQEDKAKERAWRLADPWDALKETPGIDDTTRFKVLKIFKDKVERRSFIRMDPETRKAWIQFALDEEVQESQVFEDGEDETLYGEATSDTSDSSSDEDMSDSSSDDEEEEMLNILFAMAVVLYAVVLSVCVLVLARYGAGTFGKDESDDDTSR